MEELAPLFRQATANRGTINAELRAEVREELRAVFARYSGLDQLLDHMEKHDLLELISAYHESSEAAHAYIIGNIGSIALIPSRIIQTMYKKPVGEIFAFCLLAKFPELEGRG
jgi:hypothetical protein